MCPFLPDVASQEGESSLAFGGQALIEGIMIRTPRHVVLCVRQSQDKILTEVQALSSPSQQHRALRVPFLRGGFLLLETMYLGIKGLIHSANVALEQEDEKLSNKEWALVVGLSLFIASLFFVVPFLLTSMMGLSGVVFNVVEAGVRLGIFLLYISLVSVWGEVSRIWQYHGAEHKAINAFEAGEALEVSNVRRFSRLHPRCGTSFIFAVVVIGIVLFSLMPSGDFLVRLAYRLLLIPLIATISYELSRLSGRYRNSLVMRILTAPGMGLQMLTTREPDDAMIEVAIKAVTEAVNLSKA